MSRHATKRWRGGIGRRYPDFRGTIEGFLRRCAGSGQGTIRGMQYPIVGVLGRKAARFVRLVEWAPKATIIAMKQDMSD